MKLHSLNQINIPVPCHENWNTMTEAEKGRFCGVCQKTVIDFSVMNEQEIIHFFSEKKQTEYICGRFKESQLNTASWKNRISQKLRYFALALLMAFGIPKISKAQLHKNSDEKHYLKGGIGIEYTGSFSGTIKNKENHTVLSHATVQLWKDDQLLFVTKTNNNGFYQFKSIDAGIYTLKVSKENYVPYIVKDIQILQNATVTSDIELSKTPKATKPDNDTPHKVGKIKIDYQD
jgi:hypothetical protein